MPKNAAIATTFFAATTPETFSGDGVRTELLGFSTPIRPDHYGAIALDGSDCLVVGHDQQAEPASGAALGCVGLLILSWLFFFGAPIATSALCVVCASVAVALLARNA